MTDPNINRDHQIRMCPAPGCTSQAFQASRWCQYHDALDCECPANGVSAACPKHGAVCVRGVDPKSQLLTSNLISKLRSALQKYGTHADYCALYKGPADEGCNCGLFEALGLSADGKPLSDYPYAHETTPKPARDADHCDYPDCEQHWTLVVAQARALLEPLADCDPAIRQWLKTPDLPQLPVKAGAHEWDCEQLPPGDPVRSELEAPERCPWAENGSPCIYVKGHTALHVSEARAAQIKAQCSENGFR